MPAIAAGLAWCVACAASAEFVQPLDWNRGATGSTYQSWESFPVPPGPNVPDVDEANPFGVGNAFDAAHGGNGSFLTSSLNIYSFSGIIRPRAVIPARAVEAGETTRFLVQVRSFGNLIDTVSPDALTVNGIDVAGLPGYAYEELGEETGSGGGFNGLKVDHKWTFDVPAEVIDDGPFTLDWSWGVTSSSLDRLSVDTFVQSTGAGLVPGDHDGSGSVEQADLDLVLSNWGADLSGNVPANWVGPPPDGAVDQAELDAVLSNWGRSAVPLPPVANAIPEPGAAVGLLVGALASLRVRS